MHLFYAALGFAVARWIFKRQAVVDPVTRFRSQGLAGIVPVSSLSPYNELRNPFWQKGWPS
jgi:hypothetical protein